MADGRFDDLLLAMASKHDNVEELSFSILSFFERRTDLFHVMESPHERMGFGPRMAEKMFFKHFHFFQQRYRARCQPQVLRRGLGAAAPAVEVRDEGTVESSAAASASSSGPDSAPPPQAQASSSCAAAAAATEEAAAAPSDGATGALSEEARQKMRHISTWNGAVTSKYHWSQSLREVTLEIEVEKSVARDLKVDVTATRLRIEHKGKVVLEGRLHEKVLVEETMWHLDNGIHVILSLEKAREMWWKCVLEGDEEIDTTKVESTRSMEEYDGETQGAIRKIMFDQNQKVQGKATSDQLRTAEIMKDAWNAPGSPFRGSDFDPTLLNLSGPVPDDFFVDLEKKKIEEARKGMEDGSGGPDAAANAAAP